MGIAEQKGHIVNQGMYKSSTHNEELASIHKIQVCNYGI